MNLDLGPLSAILTWKNGLIVLACGIMMEAYKHGPIVRRFARSKTGKVLQYYLPIGWCWLALFLPVGLSPDNFSLGEKIMLGVVLAAGTSSIYEWTVKAVRTALGLGPPPPPEVTADLPPPPAPQEKSVIEKILDGATPKTEAEKTLDMEPPKDPP